MLEQCCAQMAVRARNYECEKCAHTEKKRKKKSKQDESKGKSCGIIEYMFSFYWNGFCKENAKENDSEGGYKCEKQGKTDRCDHTKLKILHPVRSAQSSSLGPSQ